METEKCEKCGVEVEKGSLIRDAVDASQLRCAICSTPDRKPRKPRKRKEKPVIMAAGEMIEEIASHRADEVPPVDYGVLRKDVEGWAKECGLGPANINGPDREDFPRFGFGYNFQIMEIAGKKRMATARYTSRGLRNYWSMDSLVTG